MEQQAVIMDAARINLILAWSWILFGFLSGLLMGLFFHRENWLGGYGSHKRRLYRLGHISFFGLGVVNLCFFLTAQAIGMEGTPLSIASWSFVVGAISMPICSLAMAHFPRSHMFFGVPVISLLVGGTLMVFAVASPQLRHKPNSPLPRNVTEFQTSANQLTP
jgi:hypothetical protein